MITFVRALKSSYKTGLLSNVNNRHSLDERFHPGELDQLFDTVIASGDVGLEKPDAGIYELAAHQLGVGPQECLFVDDILAFCRAAERVGMQSIHCQDVGDTIQNVKRKTDTPHEN
jgi:epoxide hydrolase-like predicted phosphatase